MSALPLTKDQRAAYVAFVGFINNPHAKSFVLKGYAGTGKSTLVARMIKELPATLKGSKLITMDNKEWEIALTATTNKAAEALQGITGQKVKTIHSFLNLEIKKNDSTGETQLEKSSRCKNVANYILFIDEASFINQRLLTFIESLTSECKVIYIGDPAQLTPIKTNVAPVFSQGHQTAELKQVVRQSENNPIIELATAFRDMVNGKGVFKFNPDGYYVQHMNQDVFQTAILKDFNRSDYKPGSSKVLAWTNRTVIEYNLAIREAVKGVPELQQGDYVVCNSYISCRTKYGRCQIKPDQTVQITNIRPAVDLGTKGWLITMDGTHIAFMPISLAEKKKAIKKAKAELFKTNLETIEEEWIDLRAAFACTVNKSQGSTYENVYIDLNDISNCNSGSTIARMLYVAVSRAQNHVYLTGDWHKE